MPKYTLGEMMSQVTFGVGRRGDLEPSYVSFKVNEAYMEVVESVPHARREEKARAFLPAGEARVTLPSDFGTPITVAVRRVSEFVGKECGPGSTQTLTPISLADLDALKPEQGTPTKYAFFNSTLELHPTPKEDGLEIAVRYYAAAPDLEKTGDIPSVATHWRRAIILKAQELVFSDLRDDEAASAARSRYLDYVSAQQSDQARRQQVQAPQGTHVIYENPRRGAAR